MAAIKLTAQVLEKPWGRLNMAPWCAERAAAPVGEMVYTPPGGDDAELLVKLLFTGERLSVQVHPDDVAARAAGHRRGKDEAWLILDAEPGAVIGIGLRERLGQAELAAAARDGSIEALLDWRPVRAGDMLFAPSGTIHAIGAGITLVEVQQNLDVTYRLFDYGRPRALHLSDAVAVADAGPWRNLALRRRLDASRTLLVEGPSFIVERVTLGGDVRLEPEAGRPASLVVISGAGHIHGQRCEAGEVWHVESGCDSAFDAGSDVLIAYQGDRVMDNLCALQREGVPA